ncbi:unnamed protein product [Phytophthora fragariaefolia]|uniref:Unnamed protein product n=1 Tax=Phytophthora fragariaefolia TaxID=1490495 RepID=A0A9W7D8P4_9STRA|nr:unnamed protein product [Phytophthora fragariaefolia]
MFHEFCGGGDALVTAFVSRGDEVVSVIPVDLHALGPSHTPLVALAEVQTGASVQGQQQRETCRESEEDDDEIASLAELASVAATPPSLDDLLACIMGVLDRLEDREPWSQVFDPDTLPLPFPRAKRPRLAAAWKAFWTHHARAVWERAFWGPLASLSDQRRHSARKARQASARRKFEALMLRVHEALGAKFFVRLDRQRKPHRGWWYVEPAVDLLLVAQRLGLAACLNYIEAQAFERFPTISGDFGHDIRTNNGKSKSMWSTTHAMEPVLRDICASKGPKKRSQSKSKQ